MPVSQQLFVRELAIKEGYVTEEEADRLLNPYTMTGKAFERTYYEHSAFTNDNLRPVYQKCTV